jgi:hypothetical protein
MKQFPNVLVMGSPGGGKSVAAARDACQFPGGMFVYDPHKDSLARLILEHIEGNVLFDNFSSLKYTLGYELLKPAPGTREEQLARNPRRAQMFTDIMMRHRGGEIATMPLVQEWVTGLLTRTSRERGLQVTAFSRTMREGHRPRQILPEQRQAYR